VQLDLPLTHFHEFEDAYPARWTVVRMYCEGWNYNRFAGALSVRTARPTPCAGLHRRGL
jgi:hypothetical protein